MDARDPSENRITPLGQSARESAASIRYLFFVAAPLGMLVGSAIAAYDWAINELLWKRVTAMPVNVQMLSPIFALFLAGVILRLFRVTNSSMADEVVAAYHDPAVKLGTRSSLAKLAASIATMGFGGSAGMEGASKWLGATIGAVSQNALNRLGQSAFRWNPRTTLLAGGSAGIAAIFRAPLSGAVMGVESPYKHDLAHEALLPALVASATSFWAYTQFRPATPYFPVNFQYTLATRDMLAAIPLGLAAGLASHLFLGAIDAVKRVSAKLPIPLPVRMTIAGVLVSAIAFASFELLGKPVTLQAGLPVANDLLNGHYALWACLAIFVLKIAATSLTFGSGGVGGYFVPTATIGAALGACFDIGFSASHPGVYTLLGIAAFSGASYNSLLFAVVFIAEATGNVFLVVPALIACSVAVLVSAGVSNSHSQRRARSGASSTLLAIPITQVMTTSVVTAAPDDRLDAFSRDVLLGHHFKELPVVDGNGCLLGLIATSHLKKIPAARWPAMRVEELMDRIPAMLGPDESVAEAVRVLRAGPYDYVPVVDRATAKLLGIISMTDILRASESEDPSKLPERR